MSKLFSEAKIYDKIWYFHKKNLKKLKIIEIKNKKLNYFCNRAIIIYESLIERQKIIFENSSYSFIHHTWSRKF